MTMKANLVAITLACVLAAPAAFAGTKTINNNTSDTITVTVVERAGSTCSAKGTKDKTTIPAGQSGQLSYGTTYINSLTVSLTDAGSSSADRATFTCTSPGGPGTLDNAFNANSIFEIGFGTSPFGFTFSAHN
jgi:hypothetical protein